MKIIIKNNKGSIIESYYEMDKDKIKSIINNKNASVFINESKYRELHIIKWKDKNEL